MNQLLDVHQDPMDGDWRKDSLKYHGTKWNYYEDRFLEVNGLNVRYWDEGSGEPLLLVHGFGGSVEAWAWNIPDLARSHRVLAMDLPGFGLTGKPDEGYTYEYFAAFLDSFLEGLGIARAGIVGHSMGGGIAMNLALRFPARVGTLCLVAPAYGWKYPFAMHLVTVPFLGERLVVPPKSLAEVARGLRSLTHRAFRYPDITLERLFRYQRAPGFARASLRYLRNYLTPFGFTSRAQELERFYREGLPRLEQPILIVWGPEDDVVSFDSSRLLREQLPHAEFWSPQPCGHYPHGEYPEEFNACLLEFLGRAG